MKNEPPICDKKVKMKWNSPHLDEWQIHSYLLQPVCSLYPEIYANWHSKNKKRKKKKKSAGYCFPLLWKRRSKQTEGCCVQSGLHIRLRESFIIIAKPVNQIAEEKGKNRHGRVWCQGETPRNMVNNKVELQFPESFSHPNPSNMN